METEGCHLIAICCLLGVDDYILEYNITHNLYDVILYQQKSLKTLTCKTDMAVETEDNILQRLHFLSLKFTRGNVKNMSFLLIPKCQKLEKNWSNQTRLFWYSWIWELLIQLVILSKHCNPTSEFLIFQAWPRYQIRTKISIIQHFWHFLPISTHRINYHLILSEHWPCQV